jgi:hypothetical protein
MGEVQPVHRLTRIFQIVRSQRTSAREPPLATVCVKASGACSTVGSGTSDPSRVRIWSAESRVSEARSSDEFGRGAG